MRQKVQDFGSLKASSCLSLRNPIFLVLIGLFVGIIISNVLHNERQASQQLLYKQSQNIYISQIAELTQNGTGFVSMIKRDQFQSDLLQQAPTFENDHADEDINDRSLQNKLINFESNINTKPFLFVFIGIISGRENFNERQAVRDAWQIDCPKQNFTLCNFILSQISTASYSDLISTKLEQEQKQYKDLVLVNSEEGYVNLAQKTLALFQYVANNFDASFIVKTDDDAFVFPDRLHLYLINYCPTMVCPEQRLFIGQERKQSEVVLKSTNPQEAKWVNQKYLEITSLNMYMPYMLGGGYILSGSIISSIVYMQNKTGLVVTTMEDATVGLWLAGMDIIRIDDPRAFVTMGMNCCFSRTRVKQHPVLGFHRLLADICRISPRRVILHAVKNVTQMRYLGNVYRNRCQLKPLSQNI
eukprot:TRINITY_DN6040_c2_g1_i1.p1 TRINITY_DN6040_c2_g1~~TRINITY_DN6040_c2_g1_i1.p1  ORF type:complete len:415 (-),score=15.83 TRINITY_DN6040_c2_g1_i1:873-2117(-)